MVQRYLVNAGISGPMSDMRDNPGDRGRVPLQQKLYASVRQVAHVSAESFGLRMAQHEIAKADALNSTSNQTFDVTTGLHADWR